MQCSDFKPLRTTNQTQFATISCSRFFNLLPAANRIVFKNSYNSNWRFLKTGKFTPFDEVENLERVYHALVDFNLK